MGTIVQANVVGLNASKRRCLQRAQAFTLIELLAAMAVFAVLLLICANVFSSTSQAWHSGATRAEQNANVRAVLDRISVELWQATISTALVFYAGTHSPPFPADFQVSTYGEPAFALHFATMLGYAAGPGNPHEMTSIAYCIGKTAPDSPTNSYTLYWLGWKPNVVNTRAAYRNNLGGQTSLQVIDGLYKNNAMFPSRLLVNVSTFKILVNGRQADFFSEQGDAETPPNTLPRFVDIYIGVLSAENVHQANLMSGPARDRFVQNNEKRYVRRVYLPWRYAVPPPIP